MGLETNAVNVGWDFYLARQQGSATTTCAKNIYRLRTKGISFRLSGQCIWVWCSTSIRYTIKQALAHSPVPFQPTLPRFLTTHVTNYQYYLDQISSKSVE